MKPSPTILQDLGLDALTPEEQEEILLEFNEIIIENALTRLMEKMDKETLDEFEKLLESDASEEVVEQFLTHHVPGHDKVLQEAVQEIRDDILAVTSK